MTAAADNPYAVPAAAGRAAFAPVAAAKPLASRGARLAAALVDGALGIAVAVPALIAAAVSSDAGSPSLTIATIVAVVAAGALMIYQIRLLARQGQTIGKRLLGVRIVTYEGDRNPGFGKAVGLRLILNGLLGYIPGYALLDVLFIFGAERRCIHDYIAGTKVVEA